MKNKDSDLEQLTLFDLGGFQSPEVVVSKIPDKYIQTQEKVSNPMTSDLLIDSEQILELEKKGRKKIIHN